MEGARKVLPQLKEISNGSFELQELVSNIAMRVDEGERKTEKIKMINQGETKMLGPGGCRLAEECFKYLFPSPYFYGKERRKKAARPGYE